MKISGDVLVAEILHRLPTKSLKRLQCVSKEWNCLISDVFSHRTLLGPMSGLLFYHGGNRTLSYASVMDEEDPSEMWSYLRELLSSCRCKGLTPKLIHSCNGLLLFCSNKYSEDRSEYHVCNPATKEFIRLPDQPFRYYARCYLAYDLRDSPHYKVVRFFPAYASGVNVAIYSSLTGQWDDQLIQLPTVSDLVLRKQLCSTAVNHQGRLCMIHYPNNLFLFNVQKLGCEFLTLPDETVLFSSGITPILGGCKQSLYYTVDFYKQLELKVYKLDILDQSNIRTLMHTINTWVFFEQLPVPFYPLTSFLFPLAFHPDSEIIYIGLRGIIFSYDLNNKRLEVVFRCGDNGGRRETSIAFPVSPFLESLDPSGGKLHCFN